MKIKKNKTGKIMLWIGIVMTAAISAICLITKARKKKEEKCYHAMSGSIPNTAPTPKDLTPDNADGRQDVSSDRESDVCCTELYEEGSADLENVS